MNLGEVYLDVDIALDVDEDENGVENEIEDKREEEETSRCGIWQWWRHRHTEHCRKLCPPFTIPCATCAAATAAAARFALSWVPNAHAGEGLAEGG